MAKNAPTQRASPLPSPHVRSCCCPGCISWVDTTIQHRLQHPVLPRPRISPTKHLNRIDSQGIIIAKRILCTGIYLACVSPAQRDPRQKRLPPTSRLLCGRLPPTLFSVSYVVSCLSSPPLFNLIFERNKHLECFARVYRKHTRIDPAARQNDSTPLDDSLRRNHITSTLLLVPIHTYSQD